MWKKTGKEIYKGETHTHNIRARTSSMYVYTLFHMTPEFIAYLFISLLHPFMLSLPF